MRDVDLIAATRSNLTSRPHRDLGRGLLETVHETVLAAGLGRMGSRILRHQPIDIEFEGMRFSAAFRIDNLVDDRLLIKFGGATLKDGFRRPVNDYHPSAPLRESNGGGF